MELFDVLKVRMTDHKIEVIDTLLSARNADAVESMAVMRQGCEEHFFVTEPAGKYSDGDKWLAGA